MRELKKYVNKALPFEAYQVEEPTIVHDKFGNAIAAGVGDYVKVTTYKDSEIVESEVIKKHVFEATYKETSKKEDKSDKPAE